MNCPSCDGELSPSHRFCPSCGAHVSSLSQAPTAAVELPAAPVAAAAAAIPAPVGRLISSDSLPIGGFTPGMVLAGRYRIIGLIGRGGMGEVYRADDLKLGQPVALKFLPKALADDAVRRERLFAEVRIARQVSHPNICRVYDIGELEGRHFLTMEYIDGEDLASLLKRIGSLHGAKALDIARQLCAGLAAAHDKGVLHRDLKPANVMIDGRGRVRITDFGLAVAAGEEIPEADVSGTPPYMAPEQFAGKGSSIRSDIYALGLVLYEVFTGKRAFEAKTLAELRAKKETSSPTAPSEIARDIDPIVERVILRCIEKDPRQRPASAAQVAASLPGGDPLAAALAAGETPSPEMVAASGSTEGLKPWIAWLCLILAILGVGGIALMGQNINLVQRVPIAKPPDVMAEKAQEILRNAGYPDPPADSAFRFEANNSYFQNVEKDDRSPNRYEKLPPYAIQFWYRQSPRPLVHLGVSEGVSLTDPSLQNGESVVWLDSRGNLTGLRVIPAEGKPSGAVQPTDWAALFKASGIDPSKCTPVEPDSSTLLYADSRAAWTGTLTDRPDLPIRIEAASFRGKPVSWRLTAPHWDGPSISTASTLPSRAAGAIIFIVVVLLAVGLAFIVQRNLRTGRGDRRGATRLACFVLALNGIEWIFGEHHVGSVQELGFLFNSAGLWLLGAGLTWSAYIAMEPFVRRHWSGWLVGWNRLLSGSFRDPLVGRDMLVGCVGGVFGALLDNLSYPAAVLFRAPQPEPVMPSMDLFSGARAIVSGILAIVINNIGKSLLWPFMVFLLLVVLRSRWRSKWAAATALFLILILLSGASLSQSLPVLICMLLMYGCMVFLIFRFGLLTFVAMGFFYTVLDSFPITLQLSAWYSGIVLTGFVLLLAFALYAFHTSLGGQPMFGRSSLED